MSGVQNGIRWAYQSLATVVSITPNLGWLWAHKKKRKQKKA
jgi:hypothetical protein